LILFFLHQSWYIDLFLDMYWWGDHDQPYSYTPPELYPYNWVINFAQTSNFYFKCAFRFKSLLEGGGR
jgi:hypothetical protein